MNSDTISTIGKYAICLLVILGCFVLIFEGKVSDQTQPWAMMALIIGWIVRDSAGQSATVNAVKTIAATNGTTPPA